MFWKKKCLWKYPQDFTWIKMNFVRRWILANRIIRVPLDPDIGDEWKYTKIALIKKVRILFGIGLRDAKIIVEEVFPEMVWGNMKPQEDTWWQRFSYWRHKRIWK